VPLWAIPVGNINLPWQPKVTLDAELWQEFLHFANPRRPDGSRHELTNIDLHHLSRLGTAHSNWSDKTMTSVVCGVRPLGERDLFPKDILGKWVKPPTGIKGLAHQGVARVDRENGRALAGKAPLQVAHGRFDVMIHGTPHDFTPHITSSACGPLPQHA